MNEIKGDHEANRNISFLHSRTASCRPVQLDGMDWLVELCQWSLQPIETLSLSSGKRLIEDRLSNLELILRNLLNLIQNNLRLQTNNVDP